MVSTEAIGSRIRVERLNQHQSTELVSKLRSRIETTIRKGQVTVQELITCLGLALTDIGLYVNPDGNGEIELGSKLGIEMTCYVNTSHEKVASFFVNNIIIHTIPIDADGSAIKRIRRSETHLTRITIEILTQN